MTECCHKTRIVGYPCPIGRICPYDKEEKPKLKVYLYNEIGYDEPIEVTEEEILDSYWTYWLGRMTNKFGEDRQELFTKQNCIDDWCVIHFAWEKKDENDS